MATLPYPTNDHAASVNTTGAVAVGSPAQGAIQYWYGWSDSDWFRVQLTAGQTYVFAMTGVAMDSFNGTELALRDASGTQLLARPGYGMHGGAFEFTPTFSGAYFLDARTAGYGLFSGGRDNTYQVSVEHKPAGDDIGTTAATAGTLALGVQVQAIYQHAGDADWFAYTFEAGKTYALTPSAGNPVPIQLAVVDKNGVVLAQPGTAFSPATSGTYYVDASSIAPGTYGFTLSTPADDHASTTAAQGTIAAGGAVQGTLEYIGDKDWFRASLAANTFYTIELDKGSVGEAIKLQLMKPDGTATDFIQTTDANGKLVGMVRSDAAGDYFFNVAYGAYTTGDIAKPYTLTMSASTFVDDHGNAPATATAAVVGSVVPGELTGGPDQDLFAFSLSKGITYWFKVDGVQYREVYARFSHSDGSGGVGNFDGSLFGYTPMADGIYTLQLSSLDNSTSNLERIGYTVYSAKASDDYAANAAGAGKLVVGGSITGTMAAGGNDIDWIGIELAAGQTYVLSLSSNGDFAGYTGPSVRILDSNGVELKYSYGTFGFNVPALAVTPTVSGTYYYEVSAAQMGIEGPYKLTAAVGAPDDAGDRPADARPLANGAAWAGRLELQSDEDFFALSPAAGTTSVITLEPSNTVNIFQYELNLYDGNGARVQFENYSVFHVGNVVHLTFDGGRDIRYASVRSTASATQGVDYKIKASSVSDDHAGSSSTTAVVAVNGSASGTLEIPGDRDYFKVALEAGKQYAVDLYGAAGGGGTVDATDTRLLSVVDGKGLVISNPPAHATGEARALVTPAASGDYFIAVQNLFGAAALGSYRVALTALTGDTTAPTLTTVPASSVGITGNLALGFSEQVLVDAAAFSIQDSSGKHYLGAGGASTLHHAVTIDPSTFLLPGRSYTLNIAPGGVRDLAGNPYTGPSSFAFTTPAAAAQPTGGNDLLLGTGAGAAIDGGAGTDTFMMPYARSAYQVFRLDDGRFQLQPNDGTASTVLRNVERIHFLDQALAVDSSGAGGQAYRLYQAAFDRRPDSVGVGYWIGKLDQGMSLKEVASAFIASAEFTIRYGSQTSNAEFVNLLYQNVLHRTGDAGGIAYWNDLLDHGYSRADTLIGFADSPENQQVVASIIGAGFDYIPL